MEKNIRIDALKKSIFSCAPAHLYAKAIENKNIINKVNQGIEWCKEDKMSLQKIFEDTKKGLAGTLMIAAAALPFAASTASADVRTLPDPVAEEVALGLAQRYENEGKNVVVLYKGKPMDSSTEYLFEGMLLAIERDTPDAKIAVLTGGDHEGVWMYKGRRIERYSEGSIDDLSLRKDIDIALGYREPSPLLAGVSSGYAANPVAER